MRYVNVSNLQGIIFDRVYEVNGKLISQKLPENNKIMDEINEDGVTLEEFSDKVFSGVEVSDIIEGELPND